jgi:hypothetical protein
MAQAIDRDQWLETEEYVSRSTYWQYLVERWLWQAPFAVLPQPDELGGPSRKAPSVEALQDNGWLMVPESQISH